MSKSNQPPVHPGEVLYKRYFKPRGLSITEASKKLLITRSNLSTIVNGQANLSVLMALKLAKSFKTTPKYWMDLQVAYDFWRIGQRSKKTLSKVGMLA